MNAIEVLFQEPAVRAIGWALLHFIWQGALIGLLAAVALRLLRGSDADVRYVVSAIALALMATLPIVTAVQTYATATAANTVTMSGPASAAAPVIDRIESSPAAFAAAQLAPGAEEMSARVGFPALGSRFDVEPLLPIFLLVWLAG